MVYVQQGRMKYWLRWIVVLPFALICGILATFPLHWFLYLAFAHNGATLLGFIEFPNGINTKPVEYLLSPFIIAFTFILAGYKIAPKYKVKTATVLFIIYTIMWSIISLIAIFKVNISNGYIQFSSRTALALLGAIIGLCIIKTNNKKKHLKRKKTEL